MASCQYTIRCKSYVEVPDTNLNISEEIVRLTLKRYDAWVGAQAFSSFDTLLAPFVKKDNLSYKEVKQCIQSFVYGVNTPSRWGCVPTSYKLLMDDGEWCDYDAYLKRCTKEAGAKYVAIDSDGNEQVVSPYGVLKKEYSGEMYNVTINMDPDYKQFITRNHRLLLYDRLYHKYVLVDAEFVYENKLFDVMLDFKNKRFGLPYFEYHQGFNMIMTRSYNWTMESKHVDKIDVWCPSSHLGTAIFKNEEGCWIATGQTQSPFSNITLDWNCPADLKDQPAIVGGVEQDFTYGECKAEMDMINKAFMEIMNEGDYDGKLFSYPMNLAWHCA